MAHDSQVPQDGEMIPLPPELQERSKESPKLTDKQSASLAVLANWWAVYGQIYRDDPTELLAVAFRETLQDLPAKVLHEACLQAQRESPRFRPTPGRVYEIAETLLIRQEQSGQNRPKYLDAPKLSAEEREQAIRDFPLKLDGKAKGAA